MPDSDLECQSVHGDIHRKSIDDFIVQKVSFKQTESRWVREWVARLVVARWSIICSHILEQLGQPFLGSGVLLENVPSFRGSGIIRESASLALDRNQIIALSKSYKYKKWFSTVCDRKKLMLRGVGEKHTPPYLWWSVKRR